MNNKRKNEKKINKNKNKLSKKKKKKELFPFHPFYFDSLPFNTP
jgi:hypothetical protein